ncbi:hypothetical protein CPB97_009122 [Podila verticillata]|nr:hypothetical protein CPB97_009122 [Podila verticillata]
MLSSRDFDPAVEPYLAEVTYISTLDELLPASDVISVHVPLSAKTRHMFGPVQFQVMKAGSYFLNTSRGSVFNEEALVQALKSGHIAGAGLDVFEQELKMHLELLKNMNVAPWEPSRSRRFSR